MALIKSNNSLLIKDTTKEEREEMVKEAIALSTIECKRPPEEIIELYTKYVDGIMELEAVINRVDQYLANN